LNSNKASSIRIDPNNGNISIKQQDLIKPYMLIQDFLALKLYWRYAWHYAFGKNTFRDLRNGKGQLQMKVPEIYGYDWIFTFEFSNRQLKSVLMQVARPPLLKSVSLSKHDFHLYCGLLKKNCLDDLQLKDQEIESPVKFPWGLVKVGSYPDGSALKLIVHYQVFRRSCVNA